MRSMLRLAVYTQCGLWGRLLVIFEVLPCCAAHIGIRGGLAAKLQYAPQMFLVVRHSRTAEATHEVLFCLRTQTEKRRECAVAVCSGLVLGRGTKQQVVTPLKVSSPKRRDGTAGD